VRRLLRFRLLPAAAALASVMASAPASAETFEESRAFAERLADRWRMPDLSLRYLQALEDGGRIPEKDRGALSSVKLSLLQSQVIQEPDFAKREPLLKLGEAWAQSAVAKVLAEAPKTGQAGPPRPAVSTDEFRSVLCYLRVLSSGARGAPDAGVRIRKVHELAQKTFHRIEEASIEDPYEKGDLMSEVCMTDGLAVLGLRGAAGLAGPDRIKILEEGIENFQWAREYNDDSDHPEVVGFPAAYLGLAQAWRLLAEEGAPGPDGKKPTKPMEECKKAFGAVLSNPMNPNLPPSAVLEARNAAAKELLEIAIKAGALGDADKVVLEFTRKVPQRGLGKARTVLLEARVDFAKSSALKASGSSKWEEAKAKAIEKATRIKEAPGGAAWEAEQLLGDWEGISSVTRRNWRGEAKTALQAKSYPEALRKYRAALASVGKDDSARASIWGYIGECYSQQGRMMQASAAFERAARACPSWESAGNCAALAFSRMEQAVKDLPKDATSAQRKSLLLLLAGFSGHKDAPIALHQLGFLCYQERDYEGAERYLTAVPSGYEGYLKVLDLLAYARVDLVRRKDRAGGAPPEMVKKALESNQAFLDKAKGPAAAEPWVHKSAAEHFYLRIEVLSQREPAKALQFISEYPRTYPEATERIADLPRLAAVTAAASGDWATAASSWVQAVQTAGDPKPGRGWPLLGTAKALQALAEGAGKKGVQPAADLAAQIGAQIAKFQPFKFSDAARRFVENYSAKRWPEAIVALEQIRENVTDNPAAREAYMKDPGTADWIRLFEEQYPECYVETGDWAKAVDPLLALQDRMRILKQLDPPGVVPPPPLPPSAQKLWALAGTACTRVALQMPAGDARKEKALKAAETWSRLLDAASVDDAGYWEMLLDAVRANALAGRYAAAKDTVHNKWVSFNDLGGQKDRYIQAVRELAQTEPGFAPTAEEILAELTGEAK